MNVIEIERALNSVAYSRKKWNAAKSRFDKDASQIIKRLILEAAVEKMSSDQVAKCLGYTRKRVRELMRSYGLDTKHGKNLLAIDAAEALHANADLMGIDVKDFDLMSPLAYLPMGEKMRAELAMSQGQVTEVSGNDPVRDALEEAADEAEEYCHLNHYDQPPCTCFTVIKALRNRIASL